MGGMLLNKIWNLPNKRLYLEEFKEIEGIIFRQLNKDFPQRRVATIPYLKSKISFGDLDYQLESLSGANVNWNVYFKDKFDLYPPHLNGMTVSYPVRGFQCDQINIGSENYQVALDYYSYSSGLLIGPLANRIGLRYGHKGLELKVPLSEIDPKLPSHDHKEILISKDTKEIYSILGFDYKKFTEGFNDPNDLYAWVTKSKYLSPQYYAFESLNAQNRSRNDKRPEYKAFLEYVKDFPPTDKINRAILRSEIYEKYPHIKDELEKIKAGIILGYERRAKFNGTIVTDLTGLTGKNLGDFIIQFKKRAAKFETWIDSESEESVKAVILEEYRAKKDEKSPL